MLPARSLLACALALGLAAGSTLARPPAEILEDLQALQRPAADTSRRGDVDYAAEYRALLDEYTQQRAALILELYEEDPAHEQLATLLPERWQILQRSGAAQAALEEAEALVEQPLTPDDLRATAAYHSATLTAATTRNDFDATMAATERFMKLAPEDDRAASLLNTLARSVEDPDVQLKLYRRSLALFPDSRFNKYTTGKIRAAESIGQPFELAFTDAITGRQVSLQRDLRGKVVVIDFWATWCGPCIAEMPKMKNLYAEFAPRGVEFVGISLDRAESDGGLDALIKYVQENEIAWPQFYQGAFWDGEFSKSWGVNAIPALFVIDAQGRLHSTSARGKLEEMLPELLSQRDSG